MKVKLNIIDSNTVEVFARTPMEAQTLAKKATEVLFPNRWKSWTGGVVGGLAGTEEAYKSTITLKNNF